MSDLIDGIRRDLRAAADPSLAPGQQAYMKSTMPFLGVRVPEVRRLTRLVVRDLGITEPEELLAASSQLWDEAGHREERYAATMLLALPPLRGDERVVPLVEHVARTGAWWDFVDDVAHRIADQHDAHPGPTGELVREWAVDDFLWVRRLAIVSQIGRKDRTDLQLLADVIEPNLGDRDVFIRKAIGWQLREVAKVEADWVRAYVASHELSPLSRREALKRL